MITKIVVLAICLLLGNVLGRERENAEQSESKWNGRRQHSFQECNDVLDGIGWFFDLDGFANITTKATKVEERVKRSLGLRGGNCGSYPGYGVTFQSCFSTGTTYVQNNHLYNNYYRTGGYGNCLNYYNSLPLTNVVPVNTGYTGQLHGRGGLSYTVSACRSCYGGYPGISAQCNSYPYSSLTRQFVFRSEYSGYGGFGGYGGNGVYGGYGGNGVFGGYGSNGVYGGYGSNGVYGGYGSNGVYGGYGGNGVFGGYGGNAGYRGLGAYGGNGRWGSYGVGCAGGRCGGSAVVVGSSCNGCNCGCSGGCTGC